MRGLHAQVEKIQFDLCKVVSLNAAKKVFEHLEDEKSHADSNKIGTAAKSVLMLSTFIPRRRSEVSDKVMQKIVQNPSKSR